ncbi:hypothetical protein F4808DRAFT_438735 [Astrocystis sublimbata]|nr:hypothetical protein F4808DRAFT_438735 [Astrocystis sublimbata]
MPRTGVSCSDELSIALSDFKSWFSPSDAIIGTVNRKTALPGNYTVKLTFYGRAKTKIDTKTSNAWTINRGRASLFSETHILHEGDIRDDARFPFTLTVPETTQPGMVPRGDSFHRLANPKGRFLSSADDVSQHALPSSFYYKGDRSAWSGKMQESYVEYVLEAELTGPKTKKTATLPLFIHARSTPSPTTDYQLATQCRFVGIKSSLLAQQAGEEQSVWQKSRSIFSSKTPKLGLNLHVEVPGVIQLEHPDPVPIGIYLEALSDAEHTSILGDSSDTTSLPPVEVVSVNKLILKSRTEIRAPGTFVDHESGRDHEFMLRPPGPLPTPLRIPIHSIGLKSSALDTSTVAPFQLGQHMELFVDAEGTSCQGTKHEYAEERRLHPSFKTYNIHLSYTLEWKLEIRCAEVTRSVEGAAPVIVLPLSEQQERLKMQELGTEGMKRNYDDLARAADIGLTGLELVADIVQAFGG